MPNTRFRLRMICATTVLLAQNVSAGGYRVIQLENSGGALSAGINNIGQVVGTSLAASDFIGFIPTATVWNSTGQASYPLFDAFITYGNAINDAGTIAGDVLMYSGDYSYSSAYAASNPIYKDYGTESTAYGINNLGSVVGYAKAGAINGDAKSAMSNPNHAMVWNGATAVDLNPAGTAQSYAYDINDAGAVVGSVDAYAAVWNAGTVTYLGPGEAHAINASGLIAGTGGGDAVVWNGSSHTSLGPGSASAVNASGLVVGTSAGHATLWAGLQIDLNDYLDSSLKTAGWVLIEATGINDGGSISVTAYNESLGTYDAFVLSAVPEPSTWTMLFFGLGLIGFASRRTPCIKKSWQMARFLTCNFNVRFKVAVK